MRVAAGVVDDAAHGRREVALLPDVDGLGGGVRAGVAGELAAALGDEGGELGRLAVAVEDGLVTDGDQVDHVPLAPGLDGADLLGDARVARIAAGGVDVDADDHADTVLGAGVADVGESVAVSGVDADLGHTGAGNLLDVAENVIAALAATFGPSLVRGVRDTPRLSGGATEATGGLGGGRSGRGGGDGGRGNGRDRGKGVGRN